MNQLEIFVPIVVAICTGLAFLAYRHPKGYRKISILLYGFLIIASMLYITWSHGFQQGFYSANEVENYKDGLPIGLGTAFIIYIILGIYFSFLGFLPKIIHPSEQDSTKSEDA